MKALQKVLTLATLAQVVLLQPQFYSVAHSFAGDQLTLDITQPSGPNEKCVLNFINGAGQGQSSTPVGNLACGCKKVSDDSFSYTIIDKFHQNSVAGGAPIGQVLGGSAVLPYGSSGTDSTSFFTPNPTGQLLAASNFQDTGKTIDQIIAILPPELRTSTVMVVRIHNYIKRKWETELTQDTMLQWSLSGDLDKNTFQDLTIEFDPNEGAAHAIAQFTSNKLCFTIEAILINGKRNVTIQWGDQMKKNRRLNLFPPVIRGEERYQMGFRSGGTFNVVIKKDNPHSPKRNSVQSEEFYLSSWMDQNREDIRRSKIQNLVLPGTHDAGSIGFPNPTFDYYLRTQSLDITEQLKAGVRSFDLRILETPISNLPGTFFVIMHNRVPVITPEGFLFLNNVLTEVHQFIKRRVSSKEIIILDFHRFLTDLSVSDGFDFERCQQQILAHPLVTEGRLIPSSDSDKTYGQLTRGRRNKGRVVLAWNNDETLVAPFWQGVDQKFKETNIITPLLYQFFTEQFTEPQTSLVSAQDAINRPDTGPYFYHGDSSTYFSDKTRIPNLNIIHSDFIDASIMVETAIALNLIEGN